MRPTKRPKLSEAPPVYGTAPTRWRDCEYEAIDKVTDECLAEYLIGHSIELTFPSDFWPRDHGQWKGQAFDTVLDQKHFAGKLCLKVLLTAGPKKRRFGEHSFVPMCNPGGATDVSVRRTIKEQFQHASKCKDLTGNGDQAKLINRRKRAAKPPQTTPSVTRNTRSQESRVVLCSTTCQQAALLTTATLFMVEASQSEHGYLSELAPVEPKSQKEARRSAQADQWRIAEELELKTIWDMGTFEIVKQPPGVSLLPSRFTYKIKCNSDGTIAKFKARLVGRGDMQTEDEYSTTFAPTSRFMAIRSIISLACQEGM